MKIILVTVLLLVASLLGGCGTDITCNSNDVMKNLVSLSSKECKDMYDGKVMRVTGKVAPVSQLKKGTIVFEMRFTQNGLKGLGAKVKNISALKMKKISGIITTIKTMYLL